MRGIRASVKPPAGVNQEPKAMKRPSCHHGVDGMTQVVLAALDGDKTSETLVCSPCGRSANIDALSGSDADAPDR